MTRLPNLTERSQVPEPFLEAFDQIAGRRNGRVSGPFGVMLHSPEYAVRASALSNYCRQVSKLTPAQRETAIIATARHMNAAVMSGHVRGAREAGVREEVISAVAERRPLDALTEEEAEIVRFTRELLETHRVSDATYGAAQARLGDQGVVDLVGLIGWYSIVGVFLNTFEVEPPEGAPRLP